ncbi:MAG: rhamnulose-1-phosphate aldolase [Vagococcus sp.]|uniref:rhamnulose-1-phosphate aldolase n=1 Tax=Vagococcus sp. TaxID=1933889 RepID=UPI002FC7753A
MRKNILEWSLMKEMIETTTNLYRLGWDERNGGNISILLDEQELSRYLDVTCVLRKIPIDFDASKLARHYLLVTGSGKYFKNIKKSPEESLGIIRINETGTELDILWGFSNEGFPTSELPTHLMSHIARKKVDTTHRVVMHNHATHLLAMSFTHELSEKAMTKTLWKMCTECLVVFPEGIGIIPWLVPGTNEIGEITAEKLKEVRLVLWPFHGIYGTGKNLDDVFGLIETAEKAAEVYTYVKSQGGIMQEMTDEQLKKLAKQFKVIPRKGYI